MGKQRKIVHIDNELGHRKAYLELFVDLFDFTPSIGKITKRNRSSLINTKVLLFATVGKSYKRQLFVCLVRSILLKPTVSLFLGVGDFTKKKQSRFFLLDYILLKIWKSLPKQKVLSILPYDIDSSSKKFTNGWIYDPQLWDMSIKESENSFPSTELSLKAIEKSNKRKILIFLGKITKQKGFDFLIDFTENNKKDVFVVVAGRMTKECKPLGGKLKRAGMMVIDRFISDEELFSLYSIADFAWSYYKPEYDQSSGIFGRAIQLGVIPIIRSGSIISKISKSIGCNVLALNNKQIQSYILYDKFENLKFKDLNKKRLNKIGSESYLSLKSHLDL